MSAPDDYRVSLGAYVLGALEAGERVQLETHLAGCDACQEELVELAGLPGLLRQLSPQEVAGVSPDEPATEGLADRALGELRHRRRAIRRRNAFLFSLAAAMTGVLVLGSFATGLIGEGWFADTLTVTASNQASHVGASVEMRQESAGTELALSLWGVPEQQRCLMVAVGRNGVRETTATWIANYSGKAAVEGYTSLDRDDLAALDIATPDGRLLLHMPVSPA
jgi:anti-sigma factor RsiW